MNRDDAKGFTSVVESLYRPTKADRRAKAHFWALWNDGPTKGSPTPQDVLRALPGETMRKKLDDGSFCHWFLNKFEAAERLSYLAQVGLSVTEEIMTSEDAKNSDRLKAISLINDLVKATAPKQEESFADAQLAKMTEEQLEHFINRQLGAAIEKKKD